MAILTDAISILIMLFLLYMHNCISQMAYTYRQFCYLLMTWSALAVVRSCVEREASRQRHDVIPVQRAQQVQRVPATDCPTSSTQRRRVVDVPAPLPVTRRHAICLSRLQTFRTAIGAAGPCMSRNIHIAVFYPRLLHDYVISAVNYWPMHYADNWWKMKDWTCCKMATICFHLPSCIEIYPKFSIQSISLFMYC